MADRLADLACRFVHPADWTVAPLPPDTSDFDEQKAFAALVGASRGFRGARARGGRVAMVLDPGSGSMDELTLHVVDAPVAGIAKTGAKWRVAGLLASEGRDVGAIGLLKRQVLCMPRRRPTCWPTFGRSLVDAGQPSPRYTAPPWCVEGVERVTRNLLLVFLVVWCAGFARECFEALLTSSPANPKATPRPLDAIGLSTEAGHEPGAEPFVADTFLQVALLQIAESGLDEALLVAHEVPLRRGALQRVQLQFGDTEPRWRGTERDFAGVLHTAYRTAELPESFGKLARRVSFDFTWHGATAQGHRLAVVDDRLEHRDSHRGSTVSGSGGLLLPSVVVPAGQAWLYPLSNLGSVLVLRVVTERAAPAALATMAFWRHVCAALATAEPRTASVAADLDGLGEARARHPFLVADPFESACLASIVFRDRALAAAVLAKRARYFERDPALSTRASDADVYLGVSYGNGIGAVETLLGAGTVMPWSRGGFGAEHALAWRCLLLQQDPAAAQTMVEALLPRLRTNSLWLSLLQHDGLTVAEPVAAAWERLHDAAIREIGLPWSVVLLVPGGLVIYLLLPLLLALCVACGRARRAARVPLSAGILFVLALGGFVTLSEVSLRPLFAVLFLVVAAADVRAAPARSWWGRALLAFAVVGVVLAAVQGTRFEVQHPLLQSFALLASALAWWLLGWRIVEDGGWRAPAGFLGFLLVLFVLAFAGLGVEGEAMRRDGLSWLVWVAIGCMAWFLLAGRSLAVVEAARR